MGAVDATERFLIAFSSLFRQVLLKQKPSIIPRILYFRVRQRHLVITLTFVLGVQGGTNCAHLIRWIWLRVLVQWQIATALIIFLELTLWRIDCLLDFLNIMLSARNLFRIWQLLLLNGIIPCIKNIAVVLWRWLIALWEILLFFDHFGSALHHVRRLYMLRPFIAGVPWNRTRLYSLGFLLAFSTSSHSLCWHGPLRISNFWLLLQAVW